MLDVPYFVTVEKNLETIVRLLREKQAAGARSIAVRPDIHREYNDWLDTQFPLYSWGDASCQSYYRTETGRAPFLFPGGFSAYSELHAKSGLHEYETD